MKELTLATEFLISGGKNLDDFHSQIMLPTTMTIVGAVAGPGAAVGAGIAIYGAQGFIQSAPAAMQALENMNRLTDAQVAEITKEPYRYPD